MSGSTGDAPVLEGEHRLGEGMRRGVFCLGLVPVATGLMTERLRNSSRADGLEMWTSISGRFSSMTMWAASARA